MRRVKDNEGHIENETYQKKVLSFHIFFRDIQK